jgi:hypothetical protein
MSTIPFDEAVLLVVRPEVYSRSGLTEYEEGTATVIAQLRHVRALLER